MVVVVAAACVWWCIITETVVARLSGGGSARSRPAACARRLAVRACVRASVLRLEHEIHHPSRPRLLLPCCSTSSTYSRRSRFYVIIHADFYFVFCILLHSPTDAAGGCTWWSRNIYISWKKKKIQLFANDELPNGNSFCREKKICAEMTQRPILCLL